MTRPVLVFLLFFILIELSVQTCPECTCCKNGRVACDSNLSCMDGCIAGYFGQKCTETCLENCKTCVNGFECTECVRGYYNNKCTLQCGKGCLDNTCTMLSGDCLCKSSHFVNSKCDACSGLMYGDECNNTCPSNCGTCTSDTECEWCKNTFYYGPLCQYRCSVGCVNGKCNKDTGHCSDGCKTGYSGYKCDTCSSGFYGRFCDLNCTENCLTCLSTTNCSNCKSGFYGEACTKTCPIGCDGNCSLIGGKCSDCKPGFYGEYCNHTCKNETYGANCSKLCRNIDTHCYACISSVSDIYGGCTTCDMGFYPVISFGQNVSICTACPKNCLSQVCDTSGLCKIGCVRGKWGDECTFDCRINCVECNQIDGQCLECTRDTFSDNCSQTCSPACNRTDDGRICAQDTGTCLHGCKSLTKYGEYCEKHCSDACNNQSCDLKTGYCTNGCEMDYYGSFCDKTCADACQSNESKRICDDENGHCLYGCKDGFFGERCDSICDSRCLNTTCNQITGNCQHGFKGPKCVEAIQPSQEGHTTGTLIGSILGSFVAGGIIVGVAALIAFNLWRRRHDYNKQAGTHEYENTHRLDDAYEGDSPVTYEDLKSRDERLYSQIASSQQI